MSKRMDDAKKDSDLSQDCFVIMPISDADGYDSGHFMRVYEDIIKPACKSAGYSPVRADDVKQTNLIHLDILQKLISSPMAVCDLSARNPNVLFELGLRQAFDMPTVLIQDIGTPKIFDIAPLRYTEYRKELRYREVLEDQEAISRSISETKESVLKGASVNSIVKILSLSKPAAIEDNSSSDPAGVLQLIRAEIGELRSEIRKGAVARPLSNSRAAEASQGNSISLSAEANKYLNEAMGMSKVRAPVELVLKTIQMGRRRVFPMLEGSNPPWVRDEARELALKFDELEKSVLNRNE